ncbi:hypothetical protein [Aestuariibaculum suncheonense]|uniref:Lipoprotein n=1 Tax=Aestuariibaculum suncheonense TaxID=1028745 RepID=A0A8J6Q8L2_9FLAO|nr:hypothetical protein [Aestuariibaculum suncheonense]MBD0836468.1 hypothetical protein [Aestuariibaculum suncheonense]
MKKLKFITSLVLAATLTLTSCQDEIDSESGLNPNTNSANSTATSNFERTSMYDGSFDDFVDGISCSSIMYPYTATVNNQEITLLSQLDLSLVLNILGAITNDEDTVILHFPLTVQLSNYTEATINSQAEYNALMDACTEAEANAEEAINCLNIDYPVTILTFDINAEQTGSFVVETDQALYTYMSSMGDDERYSISYPITATINGDSTIEISSDADLQTRIDECTATEKTMEEAEEDAKTLEEILADTSFKVESFLVAGIDTTSDFVDYTIAFSNDLSVVADNSLNTVNGSYMVDSELEVMLELSFLGNTSLNLLNKTWTVTNYDENTITLESSTTSLLKLVLVKI